MKKEQKIQIIEQLGKLLSLFINKHCDGLHYLDLVKKLLSHTEAQIRMCVREGAEGCKKNSSKADKKTREIIRSFADMTKEEYSQTMQFQDDDDDHGKATIADN